MSFCIAAFVVAKIMTGSFLVSIPKIFILLAFNSKLFAVALTDMTSNAGNSQIDASGNNEEKSLYHSSIPS